ncbi:MAG TPA: response regulator [Thermoanaerobaculia bacterium]|jgi:DNA-binding NarL/FixJ family response regulator|nr:response regulator [Thermoanaerobaculia bacterium]
MHVLLIDDEVQVVHNLAIYLRSIYHHTVSYLTEATDEQMLHAHLDDVQPDAVILDYGMVPAGDVIYQWIKKWNPHVKIAFYTSYAHDAEFHRAMRTIGASDDEIISKREVGNDISKILKVLS